MTHDFRSMNLIARVACANIGMTGRTTTTCSEASSIALQASWEWTEPGGYSHCTLLAPVCCFDRSCRLTAGFCSLQTARANSSSSVQSYRLGIRIPSVLREDPLWTGIHVKQSPVYKDSTICNNLPFAVNTFKLNQPQLTQLPESIKALTLES